ncbi:MAG TPA: sugar phosphate nucleotidyltransferase, partial [Polyangia bacterium]
MNIRQMTDFHFQKGAMATIACLPIKKSEANQFGIVQVDEEGRVVGFQEKPDRDPVTIPGDPDHCLGSMGNYVFAPGPLIEELRADAERESHHDFGRNILPSMLKSRKVFAYNFGHNRIRGVSDEVENAYWRDVGTIDAYYEANMDLKNVVPSLNLYNWDWPIVTANYPDPPAKLVFDEDTRRGIALQSILSGGCIVAGGFVKDSVLGRNCFIDAGARVEASILFDNVYVGRGARVSRAIIDKNVRIPEGDHIGHDLARDAIRYTVSEGGITVVQKARDTLLTRSRNF